MSNSETRTNRLAGENSPYLLLHRHNPVDWYPWGEEAFERSRQEDKPIFLSVGYSTCYWCHVMERESFSDEAVAEAMNRDFVNVKLDREERPDLDEIYMTATQVLTGHGGWPNSLFLTPTLEPFFAGTYFPPEDRHGQPSFIRVLHSLAHAWENRRDDVEAQAASAAGAIRHYLDRRSAPAPQPPGADLVQRTFELLQGRFDARFGGFGEAPKFPTPSNLFLLAEVADQRPAAGEMLAATLDAMARGGIYDQLGGGFHRYATDAEWKVPHFEKMLYDNGLLLELYAREYARTSSPTAARVVRQTAEFLSREMTAPDGCFWSAMDAETDGHEGAFYVWTKAEIADVLGEEDARFLAPLLGFDGAPFFEGRYFVLHQPRDLEAQARARRTSADELLAEIEPLRRRLFEVRAERPRLLIDDKVLVDWNGMAISGLATAARLLPAPELAVQAARAAEALLETARSEDGVLLHALREGEGRIRAFLSDYVFLTRGVLALHAATGEDRWLEAAIDLTREQQQRLEDPLGGFYNAEERPDLLVRSKEIVDGALPAANAIAVLNLLDLADSTGETRWRDSADRALRSFALALERQPEAARMMAVALSRYRAGRGEEEAAADTAPAAVPLQTQSMDAVRVSWQRGAADADGWSPITVELRIADGFHLQANPAGADYLLPTELMVSGAELRRVEYPTGGILDSEFAAEALPVYTGNVEIRGELRGEGELHIGFQPCRENGCLAPVRLALGPPNDSRKTT